MAGAGYKIWSAGDVLAAAEVNTYLMEQSVMVFADSSARASAIGTPTAGMLSYLADTGTYQSYGTAWADLVPAAVVPTLTSSTATTYEIASADAGNYLRFTDAATVTFSTATAFTSGQQVQILCDGTATTIAAGTGVELAGAGTLGTANSFTVGNQYEAVAVIAVGTDAYRVIGNVTAV